MGRNTATTVSIGLRAKTARAIAVVLGGRADSPQVLRREELILADPNVPATSQPYHEVMELPWENAQVAVLASARAIEAVASKALAQLVHGLKSEGLAVCGVGVVGALERNLERIGSAHIRAHAAEGLLFRAVLDKAAEKNGLERRTFEERKLIGLAAAELGCSVAELETQLAELGRATGPPWRADEKSAAAAAWLALRAFERKRR